MHIKSILTPLLLLSCTTGVYSPSEAALTMHIYYNNKAGKPIEAQRKSVELLPLEEEPETPDLAVDRDMSIEQLRIAFNNNIKIAQHNTYIRILIALPQAHIEEKYLKDLVYWSGIVEKAHLVPFTTLFIKGDKAQAKQSLIDLVKDKTTGLFFQDASGGAELNFDKIIFQPSLTHALRDRKFKGLKLLEQTKAKQVIAALIAEDTELTAQIIKETQQAKGGAFKRVRIIITNYYKKLMQVLQVDQASSGIIIIGVLFASSVIAAYYKWDALAALVSDIKARLQRK